MAAIAHLVFCRSRTLLLKDARAPWEQIQWQYEDYMASLGPWDEWEFVDYFATDYGVDDARWPFSRASMAAFFAGTDLVLECQEPK